MARLSSSSSAPDGPGQPTGPSPAMSTTQPLTYRRQADSPDREPSDPVSAIPPSDPSLLPSGTRSLSLIAAQAFALGILLAASLASVALALHHSSPLWRLPAFLACLSGFHFLEFWTTAAYNTANARASSFLLWSNREYNIAHALAMLEALALGALAPGAQRFGGAKAVALGLALVLLGQAARSAAMVTAGSNFNHIPAKARRDGHVLVTDGIYARLRHPSYFGFFWWALGTQVLIGNRVCLLGYLLVLWRFFRNRIAAEEKYLVSFFGQDYEAYRARVGTGIPFIR